MTPQKITIRDGFYLSPVAASDKLALLEYLKTDDVHRTTMNIPFPYLASDADWWIRKRLEYARRQQNEVTFAIRHHDKLIGVIGADNFEIGTSHRAEIGYWLAKPYWGQGLMTAVVASFVRYAFAELGVLRLTAHVFEFNQASARVLEKNGFTLEGTLRKHFLKNDQVIDGRVYGLLKEETSNR